MKTNRLLLIFALSMVLLCCFSAVSASEVVDKVASEVDSDGGSIAVSNEECLESADDSDGQSLAVQYVQQADDADDSLLAIKNPDEISGLPSAEGLFTKGQSSTNPDKVLKASDSDSLSVSLVNAKKGSKISAYLATTKLKTTYGSGETFQVNLFDSKTKMPVVNAKLLLKVYTGNKYKKVIVTTSPKDLVAMYPLSKLSLGTHKVIISCLDKNVKAKPITSSITISKASLSISAPSVMNLYKKSQAFKVTVKNKKSDKAMAGVKVIIKIYTGKKYKVYKLKTNKKGFVAINTKKLSMGKHNVVIKVPATKQIKANSKKSAINIVKSKPKSKIKTEFDNVYVGYEYHRDGTFHGYSISFTLWDSNGNELKKQVILKCGKYVRSKLDSNECFLTPNMISTWGYPIVLVFEGDEKYAPCSYTLWSD